MDRVTMINWVTGTEMSVPAALVDKYLAAGHRLAEEPKAPKPKRGRPAKPKEE